MTPGTSPAHLAPPFVASSSAPPHTSAASATLGARNNSAGYFPEGCCASPFSAPATPRPLLAYFPLPSNTMALTGLRRVLGSYQRFRASQPLIADSLTAGAHPTPRAPACTLLTRLALGSGALFFAGDVLCQTIEKKKEDPYDLKRYRTMR